MSGMPPGSGSCCLPNAAGITYLQLGTQGHTVGMMGLDKVFLQLLAMERRPEDASDEELIGMARRYNYIPDIAAVEAEYGAALRGAYAAFFKRQEQEA